jgi:hypothetical protein
MKEKLLIALTLIWSFYILCSDNEIIVTIERIAGAILVALLPQILIAAIFFLRKRKEAKEK